MRSVLHRGQYVTSSAIDCPRLGERRPYSIPEPKSAASVALTAATLGEILPALADLPYTILRALMHRLAPSILGLFLVGAPMSVDIIEVFRQDRAVKGRSGAPVNPKT
jgi:hypothetical protein